MRESPVRPGSSAFRPHESRFGAIVSRLNLTEVFVFFGEREAELLAQSPNIGEISGVWWIAEVKIDHDLRRYAAHSPVTDCSDARQVMSGVGDTADIGSLVVEDVAVYVDPPQVIVLHHEVVLPGVVGRYLHESQVIEELSQRGDVVRRHGNIEIEMPPRVTSE